MQPLPAVRTFPLPNRPATSDRDRATLSREGLRAAAGPWRGRALAVTAVGALAVAGTASYDVRPGDTLSAIAAANGTTVEELAAANGIVDPDRIVAGQQLTLPDAPDVGSATPSGDDPGPATPAGDRIDDVGALLDDTARQYGFSPRFVKAIAWQESGWQQDRVSSAGAIGIMQVMPDTGRFVSTELAGRDLDLDDPADNVEAGVRFLQYLWELTGGDVELTLAGYYQGLGSVSANGWYDDTERYVANVLALRHRF